MRVAEEALRRGHPDQAVIAYHKAADRFRLMGQLVKQMAVLQHLVRLEPDNLDNHRELIAVYDELGRHHEAATVRLRLARELRQRGHGHEAERIERQARAMAFHRNSDDDDEDTGAEMPGEAVAPGALEDRAELGRGGRSPSVLYPTDPSPVATPDDERTMASDIDGPDDTGSGPAWAYPSEDVDLSSDDDLIAPSVRARSRRPKPVDQTIATSPPPLRDTDPFESTDDDFDDCKETAAIGVVSPVVPGGGLPASAGSVAGLTTAAVAIEETVLLDDEGTASLTHAPIGADLDRLADATYASDPSSLAGEAAVHEPTSDGELGLGAETTMTLPVIDPVVQSALSEPVAVGDDMTHAFAQQTSAGGPGAIDVEIEALGGDFSEDDVIDTDAGPVPRTAQVMSEATVTDERLPDMNPDPTVLEDEHPDDLGRTRAYEPDEIARLQKWLDDERQ